MGKLIIRIDFHNTLYKNKSWNEELIKYGIEEINKGNDVILFTDSVDEELEEIINSLEKKGWNFSNNEEKKFYVGIKPKYDILIDDKSYNIKNLKWR